MIEQIDINDVKENPKNPRTISDDKFQKLVKSIKDFPEMLELRPIIIDKKNMVLGGNMRLKACKEAGLSDIHIIKADKLTPKQKKEFIIKDNIAFGQDDWDVLQEDWELSQLEDWGMEIPEDIQEIDISDIIEVEDFSKEATFRIVCKDLDDFEALQERLKATGKEMKFDKFIEVVGL